MLAEASNVLGNHAPRFRYTKRGALRNVHERCALLLRNVFFYCANVFLASYLVNGEIYPYVRLYYFNLSWTASYVLTIVCTIAQQHSCTGGLCI